VARPGSLRPSLAVLALAASMLAGCAGTRVARFGPLPNQEPLVTLIVSQDPEVVRRECPDHPGPLKVMGCQRSRTVELVGGERVLAITIVRYTDALPSALAFEIDAHELCHAAATLQGIVDPCHDGNAGLLRAGDERRPPLR
jgi:hypothetical protein